MSRRAAIRRRAVRSRDCACGDPANSHASAEARTLGRVWSSLAETQHLLRACAAIDAARGRRSSRTSPPLRPGIPGRRGSLGARRSSRRYGFASNRAVGRHEAALGEPGDGRARSGEIAHARGTRAQDRRRRGCARARFSTRWCAARARPPSHGVDRDELVAAVRLRRPLHGVAGRGGAHWVSRAVARSRPLESLSRVAVRQSSGFPQPEQQHEYRGSAGRRYSRRLLLAGVRRDRRGGRPREVRGPAFLRGRTPSRRCGTRSGGRTRLRAQRPRDSCGWSWDDAWNRHGSRSPNLTPRRHPDVVVERDRAFVTRRVHGSTMLASRERARARGRRPRHARVAANASGVANSSSSTPARVRAPSH